MYSRAGPTIFSELEGLNCFRGYGIQTIAGCSIVQHPRWGSHVFPAAMFVSAPRDLLLALLSEHSHHQVDAERPREAL